MDDERQENSPLDEGSEMIAHSAQAAYAVSAAVKAGRTAAGAAAGTAMAGPAWNISRNLGWQQNSLEGVWCYISISFFVDVYYCKHDRNYISLSGFCQRGFLCK